MLDVQDAIELIELHFEKGWTGVLMVLLMVWLSF
jgi:hypothetical protein